MNWIAVGLTVNGALLDGAMVIEAVWTKPDEVSVPCMSAVCAGASESTRTRMRAVPELSVVVVPDVLSVSVLPAADVMMRTSPETTSKRTVLPTSGTPF